jgi:hypothetical protein
LWAPVSRFFGVRCYEINETTLKVLQAATNSIQQFGKLLLAQTRLADQSPQSPFGQFPMVRHGQPALARIPQDDVTAV